MSDTCRTTTTVSCCIDAVLTQAFAKWSAATGQPVPPTTTPPGTIGMTPDALNPYVSCHDALAAAAPQFRDPGSSMKYQLFAIRGVLALTGFLALLTLLWRWWKEGPAGVWLLRRMPGAKGTYVVPNPSTLFLLPIIAFTVACQLVVHKALVVIQTASTLSTNWMLLLFILCMDSLWVAGFIQGAALLFSVDRFLSPRGNQGIWVSSTSNPLSIQNVPPWLLNAIMIALPAAMVIGSITAGALGSAREKLAITTYEDALRDIKALADQYAAANGMTLPSTSDVDDQVYRNLLIYNNSKDASLAAFVIVVTFDVLFIILYYRFAWAVISVLRRQLALLKETTEHFGSGRDPRRRRPSRLLERAWSRGTEDSNAGTSSMGIPVAEGPRRSDSFGRDDRLEEEERAVKRRRLLAAYYSIVCLAATMLIIAAVDIAFCAWAVSDESFTLFIYLLPAALWIWAITSLVAVGIIAWQAFAFYTPTPPARSVVAIRAPRHPHRDYDYGRGEEEINDSDSLFRAAVVAKAQAEARRQPPAISIVASTSADKSQLSAEPFFGGYPPPELFRMDRHPYAAPDGERRRQEEDVEVMTASASDKSSSDPSSKPSNEDAPSAWPSPPRSQGRQLFTPSLHFRAAFESTKEDEHDEGDDEKDIRQ